MTHVPLTHVPLALEAGTASRHEADTARPSIRLTGQSAIARGRRATLAGAGQTLLASATLPWRSHPVPAKKNAPLPTREGQVGGDGAPLSAPLQTPPC